MSSGANISAVNYSTETDAMENNKSGEQLGSKSLSELR